MRSPTMLYNASSIRGGRAKRFPGRCAKMKKFFEDLDKKTKNK